jgi:mono/diheme cytochrome c family protein
MRLLALIGLLAILALVGGAAFFFGGYYDVAASSSEPALVSGALIRVREASISRGATAAPPIKLDEPATVQAGAQAFAARGCAHCHGAPGVDYAKFAEGMNPAPPDLAETAKRLPPAQIFWVVRNGIRMTGMPSFAAIGAKDDEIWKIAAFVAKLADVSEADYKAWTAAAAPPSPAQIPASPAPPAQ